VVADRPLVPKLEGTNMYVDPNYKTKKAFKDAIAGGARPEVYNPSGMYPAPQSGRTCVEGPHYPAPHKWYASVQLENGCVVKVLS
jgi:hypothetical protein